jgi:type II secretory pathway pseudopilin PulG
MSAGSEFEKQENWRKDVRAFCPLIMKNYVTWVGVFAGGAAISTYQFFGGKIPLWAGPTVLCLALVIASFMAWRDERAKAGKAEKALGELERQLRELRTTHAEEKQRKIEAAGADMAVASALVVLQTRLREVQSLDPHAPSEPLDFNENDRSKAAVAATWTAIQEHYGLTEAVYFSNDTGFVPSPARDYLQSQRTWRLHRDYLAYRLARVEKIIERNPRR